jgi:hypothetical protein
MDFLLELSRRTSENASSTHLGEWRMEYTTAIMPLARHETLLFDQFPRKPSRRSSEKTPSGGTPVSKGETGPATPL